jgi:hypothetical protein
VRAAGPRAGKPGVEQPPFGGGSVCTSAAGRLGVWAQPRPEQQRGRQARCMRTWFKDQVFCYSVPRSPASKAIQALHGLDCQAAALCDWDSGG